MGFTVRLLLGLVVVALSPWSLEAANSIQTQDEVKKVAGGVNDSTLTNLNNKPKTDEKESNLVVKLEQSEPYHRVTVEPEEKSTRDSPRSIDISRFLSKEFHNRNNVFTMPVSPDTEKFMKYDDDYHSTTHKFAEHVEEFDYTAELTTPKSSFFDQKYNEAVQSVDQTMEHIDEAHEGTSETTDEGLNVDQMYQQTKRNDTKADLNYINYQNIVADGKVNKSNTRNGLVVEAGTNLDFHSSYNNTEIIDEEDNGNNTIPKQSIIEEVRVEASTKPNDILTTRKSIVLTKPPSNKNSSHISILSNKIETESIKATTERSPKDREVYTKRAPLDITKRGSVKFSDYAFSTSTQPTINKKRIEQLVQENQIVPIHVEAPLNVDRSVETTTTEESTTTEEFTEISTTEGISTTETTVKPETTTILLDDTTTTTTEVASTSTQTESSETTTDTLRMRTDNSQTSSEEVPTSTVDSSSTAEPTETTTILETTTENSEQSTTLQATTASNQRTSKGFVFSNDITTGQEPPTTKESTTEELTMKPTTPIQDFTESATTELPTDTTLISNYQRKNVIPTTTPMTSSEETTDEKETKFPTTTTTEIVFVHIESVDNHTTLKPEVFKSDQSYPVVEVESSTENMTTSSDSGELTTPPEDNSGTIAAITISSIGAVCLILLAGLLIIMRKRQKRFNYGQRCTPVSLDDYSMDNISVYNSVRRKAMLRSSKRSYGNPAFEDPSSISHPLNFPALGKFASNFEDIKSEFEDIPQISARTNELPEGCDTKNRYANVIPLPETRVFLSPIDGDPTSDYINANYVTGPKNIKGYYIACQAPMQNTVDDFWRMIWEQQSKVILMVTHLVENGMEKCFDYLPPSEVLDCHRLFGDFQVTLKKREVKEKYIISILQLKNMVSNSWREVTHFWYLGWPEKGVPAEANSLIAFLIEARSYMKSSSLDRKTPDVTNGNLTNGTTKNELNPVVVHCSPGTGRTGVVIACDIAIREFEQTRLVDLPRIVYKIRRDRASSVQTKDQYAFIYKVINLYATKLTGGALDSL